MADDKTVEMLFLIKGLSPALLENFIQAIEFLINGL